MNTRLASLLHSVCCATGLCCDRSCVYGAIGYLDTEKYYSRGMKASWYGHRQFLKLMCLRFISTLYMDLLNLTSAYYCLTPCVFSLSVDGWCLWYYTHTAYVAVLPLCVYRHLVFARDNRPLCLYSCLCVSVSMCVVVHTD